MCVTIDAPQQVAPLSTATVTSQTPTLRWNLAQNTDGAQVQICRDRACTQVVQTFAAPGFAGQPPAALSAGVYFWNLAGTSMGVVGSATSPTWEFWVGHRTAAVDSSWGTTLDVNGDGLPDVIGGGLHDHTAYLYVSSDGGLGDTPVVLPDPAAPYSNGLRVASAGDVNGDGFGDFIVGDVDATAAYVYLGGPAGPSATFTTLTVPNGAFGFSVSSAGDVNGDGYADVIVSDPALLSAYIYLGSSTGLATTPATTLVQPNRAVGPYFGDSVSSAGDVNGDGYGDVIVNDWYANAAYVYLGGPQGTSDVPSVTLTGSYYGYTVACAGDVNGDGLADVLVTDQLGNFFIYLGTGTGVSTTAASVLVGYPGAGVGDVNGDGFGDVVAGSSVFLGSASGLPTSPSSTLSTSGNWVSGAGDVNGDGYDDFLVVSSGVAYLYEGSATGPQTAPVWTSGASLYTAQ